MIFYRSYWIRVLICLFFTLDVLARYTNVVLLDILELQVDPRPLCNTIVKILTQEDDIMTSCPLHTGLLLEYVTHWSTGLTGKTDGRKFSKKFKQQLKGGLLVQCNSKVYIL
jgi:hypothetical protein